MKTIKFLYISQLVITTSIVLARAMNVGWKPGHSVVLLGSLCIGLVGYTITKCCKRNEI